MMVSIKTISHTQHCWVWLSLLFVCQQADSDGIIHRYCPAHLEDSDLKPNITCAVYNHDGTGISTVMMLFGLTEVLFCNMQGIGYCWMMHIVSPSPFIFLSILP